VNVNLAELEKAAELLPASLPVMATGGFTINELVEHTGRNRPSLNRQVLDLVHAGKYVLVGRRPGRNGANVYVVK